MTSSPVPVPAGTTVTYHGSVGEAHGNATVTGFVTDHDGKSADGYRYTLSSVAGTLRNTRRQSFTLPEDGEVKDVLTQVKDLLDDLFDPWKADRAPVKPGEHIPAGDVAQRAGLEWAEANALQFIGNFLMPLGPTDPKEL